jgi:hypothetical protein
MFSRYNITSGQDVREAMIRTQRHIAQPSADRQPTPIRQATGGKD